MGLSNLVAELRAVSGKSYGERDPARTSAAGSSALQAHGENFLAKDLSAQLAKGVPLRVRERSHFEGDEAGSPPLFGASVLSASRLEPLAPFSLSIAGQVLTFRTRARLSFAPPPCRMPLGQSQCIPQADPRGMATPWF